MNYTTIPSGNETQRCPMTFNIPTANASGPSEYECIGEKCAWWEEDTEECTILARSRRLRDIKHAIELCYTYISG
jgi:hypothetical protein